MTWEQLSDLTVSNGAIDSLKKLIVAKVFEDPNLDNFFTLMRSVKNGDKLGFIGKMSDVGLAGSGCDPEYKSATIDMLEKEWAIGEWHIALKICYKELENTIAEYCLKNGTEIADLTSTEYMRDIYLPKLEEAMTDMFWRIVWFGDTEANVHTSSGVLSTGVDPELFKACDGLWKHIFAIGTANASQKVTIAANDEVSTAEQMSKIKEAGAAIKIFDELIENADPRIASLPGAAIFATKSLTDALTKDLRREYKEILTWEQIFNGLRYSEYNGVKIYSIPVWDRMIMKYQNNGTKLNIPHRAIFTAPSELLVGTPANDIVSDISNWFAMKDRNNYTYSCGKIGTLISQDDLLMAAY